MPTLKETVEGVPLDPSVATTTCSSSVAVTMSATKVSGSPARKRPRTSSRKPSRASSP